jgi:hypothetical protein
VWQVTRSSDPVTGATRCIVAAYDQARGKSFSRTGTLYPIVENSSVHGVLVGVSSGGRFRLPTGDIVWRVDDRPFRTPAAADNPAGATTAMPQESADMQRLVDQQMRIVNAVTATSTVASGDTRAPCSPRCSQDTGLCIVQRQPQTATVFRPAPNSASGKSPGMASVPIRSTRASAPG